MKILVTGGAGFIGTHLVAALRERGHAVRLYDNLDPQVHGTDCSKPKSLPQDAEFIRGDIRDRDSLQQALEGIEAVFHLASAVGVGQSMYQVRHYADVNSTGTATLLDIIVNEKTRVEKLILSSSMSLFGEGKYQCGQCGVVAPSVRPLEQLAQSDWELHCPVCKAHVTPLPTDESKPLEPTSVYATTKRDQEEMFVQIGSAYGIPTGVLRYFNVYGPGQALSNPYTGVIAIFANSILAGESPVVFEDGRQTRDFTHVKDIVQANLLLLEKHTQGVEIFNVGTGVATDLKQMLDHLYRELTGGNNASANVLGRYRAGDIRHCFADHSKLQRTLGFSPQISLAEGIKDLAGWLKTEAPSNVSAGALAELEQKGLVK